ncbi:MAG: co-chaperone GroES [Candidatus Levybacteria bacterium RIFCSPHIGHO2_01_FULL_40_10]|nr:MAG: co-chaperone GroES [Candidatus Levybacteria bacterium RIFCSPHIGHO2_01_FULL_40_10]
MVKSDSTNIKPLFNNVLVKPLEAEGKTAGGIYLPETAKEKPQVGIVMAVGEGEVTPKGESRRMTVKVGQKVMYKKWGGNEVKVGNEEWTIVEEKDILAVVG